jgi:acyl-CoA thioesterase-1
MKRLFGMLALMIAVALAGCASVGGTGTDPVSSDCMPFPQGSGPYTYVAIGASDAVGFGATCPATQGYVPLLGQRMPAHTRVVNLGISGATVQVALRDEVQFALAAKPNIITVWLAANDFRAMESGKLTLATYTQQLDQLLGQLHAGTHAHVYVADLPDLTKLPYFIHGTVPLPTIAAQTNTWNAAITAVIAKNGDVLVDLYHASLAAHPDYIWIDGFHPSTKGYAVLAGVFWAVMQAHGDPQAKPMG